MRREDLKPLTSLRFVAALLVFVYHSSIAQPFARDHFLGQAGVGFFFVLSGFILTYTYAGRLDDIRAYAGARFARIYPTLVVTMLLTLLLFSRFGGLIWTASTPAQRIEAAVAQLLLVQAWMPNQYIYVGANPPGWSISVEAFFYVLFPCLLARLSRTFRSSTIGSIIAAAVMTWAVAALLNATIIRPSVIPPKTFVWASYVLPLTRLPDFIVGMLLGLAFLRGYRLRGWALGWTLSSFLAVALVVAATPMLPPSFRSGLAILPAWASLIGVMAVSDGPIARALRNPIAVRLGEASFAFYLVHFGMLTAADSVFGERSALGFVVAFIAVIGVAFAVHLLVETPLRKRILRSFGVRRTTNLVEQRTN